MRKLLLVLALFSLSAHAEPCRPRHFMVMFGIEGMQHPPFRVLGLSEFLEAASRAHTFATFVETKCGTVTEELTISWLPRQDSFGPGYSMPHPGIVPGHNYTLDQTFWLYQRKPVIAWGPYEIDDRFYARARSRVRFLDTEGWTRYKMVLPIRTRLRMPTLYDRPGGSINCIMAVSDLGGYLDTDKAFGYEASQLVLNHFAGMGLLLSNRPDVETWQAMRLDDRIARYGLQRIR